MHAYTHSFIHRVIRQVSSIVVVESDERLILRELVVWVIWFLFSLSSNIQKWQHAVSLLSHTLNPAQEFCGWMKTPTCYFSGEQALFLWEDKLVLWLGASNHVRAAPIGEKALLFQIPLWYRGSRPARCFTFPSHNVLWGMRPESHSNYTLFD